MNDLLASILDTLIPPSHDGRMPGAGSLGLEDRVRDETAEAGEMIREGLEAASFRGFVQLDSDARAAVLQEIDASQPAFLPALYTRTCIAYYQHPDVRVGLGLPPHPPHPKGYELEPGDLAALERVRRRGKCYRDAV
jgi:hypothetical protein